MKNRATLITLLAWAWIEGARAATWYVSTNGNDGAAGVSWETAKLTIQTAIDVAAASDTVLVSNGVYATGGRVVYGAMSNRVALTKALSVQSVNGPAVTTIQGAGPMGATAVRCAYVGTNAVLSGFTLKGGATLAAGDLYREQSGGGAYGETNAMAVLTNCLLSGNVAYNAAGVYGGTLRNCTLSLNTAQNAGGGSLSSQLYDCTLSGNRAAWYGGGTCSSTLSNCVLSGNSVTGSGSAGGGAYAGALNRCALSGNSAPAGTGGGAYSSPLTNCTLTANSASSGGGSYYGTLCNCLLTGNSASYGGGSQYDTAYNCTLAGNTAGQGGGAYGGSFYNCIVYNNTAGTGPNYTSSTLRYCCTTPLPVGVGNFTSAPLFQDTANYHLSAGSPCLNAGNNAYAPQATDLDGTPRIAGGTVDLGAYEYQPSAPLTGYEAWAAAITNGQTNYTDCATGDGYPNLLKYATGSSPTQPDTLARLSAVFTPEGQFAVVFNRNTNAVDVTIIVEATSVLPGASWVGLATNKLGSWGGAANAVESAGATPVSVRVLDIVPPASSRFVRLRVTRP